jgi:hypothetical protein
MPILTFNSDNTIRAYARNKGCAEVHGVAINLLAIG